MLYTKENTKFNVKPSPYKDGWHEKACVECGDKFFCNRHTGKYCSQRCVNDAMMRRRKQRNSERRIRQTNCLVCDTPIIQKEYCKIRRYCSNACKQKAYRRKVKANGGIAYAKP